MSTFHFIMIGFLSGIGFVSSETVDSSMAGYAEYVNTYGKRYTSDKFLEHYGYYRDNIVYINTQECK